MPGKLIELIKKNGPMPINQFMKEVLFGEKGYYKTANPLGEDADFITSPEISKFFGEILAIFVLSIYSQNNKKFSFIEIGAGKGTLYYDILTTIKKLSKTSKLAEDFVLNSKFYIIEINSILTKIQKEKLKNFNITWFDNFIDFNELYKDLYKDDKYIPFIYCNELFDCFPIKQYKKMGGFWLEKFVDYNQFLYFVYNQTDVETNKFINKIINIDIKLLPDGSIFEYSEELIQYFNKILDFIKKFKGYFLAIDYGYVKRDFYNSLQAIYRHKKISPLSYTYQADLTAHVDFSILSEIAKVRNFNYSIASQRDFLINYGIIDRVEKFKSLNNENTSKQIDSELNRLISPDEMGELFKFFFVWN